jgi:hypothetical protein
MQRPLLALLVAMSVQPLQKTADGQLAKINIGNGRFVWAQLEENTHGEAVQSQTIVFFNKEESIGVRDHIGAEINHYIANGGAIEFDETNHPDLVPLFVTMKHRLEELKKSKTSGKAARTGRSAAATA